MSNNTPIQISSPTALIAAIPALFGFIPAESGVFVALKDSEILFNARQDFAAMVHIAPHIMDVARQHDATSMILLAITSDLDEAAQVLDGVGQIVELKGMDVTKKIHTPTCEAGNLWTDLGNATTGLTEDYRSSIMTATQVVNGKAIVSSRNDLHALFALTDPVDTGSVNTASPTRYLDIARQVYAIITGDAESSGELAAQVGRAVTDNVQVRDALITVGSAAPAAAAHLFITIAAALRGQTRAEVLTLVAALCAITGQGAKVNVAIEQAEAATTELPNLLNLIDQAVAAGASPEMLSQALVLPPEYAHKVLGGDHTI
ncbi:DUF4192 domain-containing protein [Nocardia sp. 348MFTsu5.1]|uniref:DUF4192 domain-containing protein n=1 Tax=Nocardia sp. 348MFTsu5.1 TaxID=1172185 RepID=UPI00035FFF91|nr:DUF4192 domain-containing protein [Nocardia sp. 348MFTsu5.1]